MGDDFDGFAGTATQCAPAAAGPVAEAVRSVTEALAAAADAGAWQLDEQAVQSRLTEVLAARASLEELAARLVRSVADRELPRIAGASSTRAWLMSTHGLSSSDAARLVAESQAHPGDPHALDGTQPRTEPLRQAWAAGTLSAERAVVVAETVARLRSDLPPRATDDLQTDLANSYTTLGFQEFKRVCAHAVEVVDPDAADALLEAQLLAEEARALQRTSLTFRRAGDDTSRLHGILPDAQADMFKSALDAYSSPRRGARRDPGDSYFPAPEDDSADQLSYPQRIGRAPLELLEHLPTDKLPQHGVTNAQIVVTVGFDKLRRGLGEAMLDTGTTISVGQARRLACNAQLLPAVLDGDSKILDLGTAKRLFDRHQRIALTVRDGGCIWSGCDRQPAWCEAHHTIRWGRSGPTELANGCLLCPYHHHLIHQGEWAVQMAVDGIPEIAPPARIDTEQQPRRHQRLKPRRC